MFDGMIIWVTGLCSLLWWPCSFLILDVPFATVDGHYCDLITHGVAERTQLEWTFWLHGRSWPKSEAQSLPGPYSKVRAIFCMVCTFPDFRWHDLAPDL